VGQKKPDEAAARFTALGYTFGGHRGGGYGQLRSLKPKPDAVVKEAGLHGETWHHGCGLGTDCIGMTYASPVSDGEHVYITTAFAGAACFDLDGNLCWLRAIVPAKTTETYARSPLLYRDLLVSDYFGRTVALDKATGELRWSVDTAGGSIATPAIITVDGTDVLLTEGGQGGRSLQAVRLPDGKRLTVEGWGIGGTQILASSDQRDVAFFCGRGQHSFWSESADAPKPPAAVRFALDGETLKATVLWTGDAFVGAGGFVGMTYFGGKLYCSAGGSAVVIDAATGKLLAGGMGKPSGNRALPSTKHLLLLAGDRFYGLDGSERTCDGNFQTFATLTCTSLDGKPLGKSVLTAMPVEGEKLAQTRSQVGWDRWPFAYGFPFTVDGNRLYVRSFDQLVCIGEE
jgi:hypothetical protein